LTQAKLQQESDKEDVFIGVVEQSKQSKATPEENTMSLKVDERDWFICLQSNGSKIRYKMDTGAQANVLPLSTYNQLNIKPILEETNVKLSAYNATSQARVFYFRTALQQRPLFPLVT
jgi:predicted aspartyl protease